MEALTTLITSVLDMAGDIIDAIVANPVLGIPLAAGILGSVIGVVRRLRHV